MLDGTNEDSNGSIVFVGLRLIVYIGAGYPSYREGDIIAIIYGLQVPVVLRKDEKAPGHYKVMEECYVHEYMNGEAIGNFDEMDFVLS